MTVAPADDSNPFVEEGFKAYKIMVPLTAVVHMWLHWVRNDGKMVVPPSKRKLKKQTTITYFHTFRHGTFLEITATCIGLLLTFVSGSNNTINFIMMGEMTTAYVERTDAASHRLTAQLTILSHFGGGRRLVNATHVENMEALFEDAVAYVICSMSLGVVCVSFMTLGVVLINWSALRQITRIRMLFLKSVLRQEMSWFDTDKDFNLASQMTENLGKLKEGFGEKLATVSVSLGSAVFPIFVNIAIGWKLSLVCLAVMSLYLVLAAAIFNYQSKSATQEMESYSQAGKHAEEIFKSVKTVVAFGGESVETSRYSVLLEPAERFGRKRGLFSGLGIGCNWVLMYCVSAACVSYGVRLFLQDKHQPPDQQIYIVGTVITILFNAMSSTTMFTMCMPMLEVFAAARSAAAGVFQLIDRQPNIDTSDERGLTPLTVQGDIALDNICFSYPARPDVTILNNFSLRIQHGECVALVGTSGCGKSTILHLLQKLYEPLSGSVKLDGRHLRDLNLKWLRKTFGVVGQEPVLFRGTIYENIAIGCPDVSLAEVQKVASIANAHDFIKNLPMGYDTLIGERGASLSGGQKQRIAIARALLRDPAVLLLDEPTSALDPHSEQQVQAALDRACIGRTTIVVSHRLSTIVNANRIVCIDKGVIIEQGTHGELIQKEGFYYKLVTTSNHSHKESSIFEDITPPPFNDATEKHQTLDIINKGVRRRTSTLSKSSTISAKLRGVKYSSDVDTESDHEVIDEVSGWQIMKLNAPEWLNITVGSIAAFVQGTCFSFFGLLMAYFSAVFVIEDEARLVHLADVYSGLFVAVAAVAAVCTCLQSYNFTVAGLRMTTRLRVQYFGALLKQEIGYFNKPSNTVGALCAQLSGDTAEVQSATGLKIGIILQAFSSIFIGICLGLYYDWRLTLVLSASLPLPMGSTWLEGRLSQRSQLQECNALEDAAGLATEAILAVRTVQTLGIEKTFLDKFEKSLNEARSAIAHTSWFRGFVMGLSIYTPLFSCCMCFLYGTTLIMKEAMEYKVIMLVMTCIVFGACTLGQTLQYTSSFSKVHKSAARILSVINRKPLVHTQHGLDDKINWSATGNFSLNRVEFTYPNRKQHKVLRGLNLTVEAGKTVALVGHSGCGKTTVLELLQRFYDPDTGTIELDGINTKSMLTLPQLRKQLGVVQQEPVLFDRSLAENVAYGDNTREVSMNEIIAACQAANIHSFIASLPQGYGTNLGSCGAQLSGGQKQRVCIARALIRSPRLLLLDEATSALDANSEKVVSDALEKAAQDRTCVMIAHRLSTVKNADIICLIDKGRIVEKGNHRELMKLQGLYYQMCKEQNIS